MLQACTAIYTLDHGVIYIMVQGVNPHSWMNPLPQTFLDTGAAPLGQAELKARGAEFRVQGVPRIRRALRETQGGGFGNPETQPHAWTVWVMVDGQWRQLVSARGHPREWTSLDRVERFLADIGFTGFEVENPLA